MTLVICAILLTTGTAFMVLAGIGVLRMPDILLRMSTTTKASTLGVGCILLATALYFRDSATITRSFAAIVFLFLTAPVSAHMIGRAAYFMGVPLWRRTKIDELAGKYSSDPAEQGEPDPPAPMER